MNESYNPNLNDVARLVSGTREGEAVPEAAPLLHWLIEKDPRLDDLWKTAHEIRDGGVTLLEVAALSRELDFEGEGRSPSAACATAVKLLRSRGETRELWERLEQMGRDAGLAADWPGVGTHILLAHSDVDRLLASDDWATSEECLDPEREVRLDRDLWLAIVEARLSRGEGDVERLARVREKLRAEIALLQSEHQPELSSC
jgi:hypothetical protein